MPTPAPPSDDIPPTSPGLWIEENEGEDGLAGDRAGFELLRNEITRLLEGTEDSVRLNEPWIQLQALRLVTITSSPPLRPESLRDKILATIFTILLLSVPLFAIYGFIQFIRTLFRF